MSDREGRSDNWFPVPPTMATNEKLLRGSTAALRLWHALAAMVRWKNDPTGRYRAGECWPSQRYLQKRYGWSSHTINAGISELEKMELLDVSVPAVGSAHYFLRGFVAFGGEPAEDGTCLENRGMTASKNEASRFGNRCGDASKNEAERSGMERPEKNEGSRCLDNRGSRPELRLDGLETILRSVEAADMAGSDKQKRNFARALLRRLGLNRSQAFLVLPGVAGRDVIKLDDLITAFEAASDVEAPRPHRRCPQPGCVRGQIPDEEAMKGRLGGDTVRKPCPICAAVGMTR